MIIFQTTTHHHYPTVINSDDSESIYKTQDVTKCKYT